MSQTYYRIESLERMTEIRVLGGYYNLLDIQARILPERLLIRDLIDNTEERWEEISEEEFERFANHCRTHLLHRDF